MTVGKTLFWVCWLSILAALIRDPIMIHVSLVWLLIGSMVIFAAGIEAYRQRIRYWQRKGRIMVIPIRGGR